jgi:hypothetical protein
LSEDIVSGVPVPSVQGIASLGKKLPPMRELQRSKLTSAAKVLALLLLNFISSLNSKAFGVGECSNPDDVILLSIKSLPPNLSFTLLPGVANAPPPGPVNKALICRYSPTASKVFAGSVYSKPVAVVKEVEVEA